MVSLENTRDQWNNPLVSGFATVAGCFQWFSVISLPHCKDNNYFQIKQQL